MDKPCGKSDSKKRENKPGRKKHYLNNVDVPLSKTDVKVVKSNAAEPVEPIPHSVLKPPACEQPKASSSHPSKYDLPELFSSLVISKQIEALKKKEHLSLTSTAQLTPISKKKLNTKITKKLNHQSDINVFKKLTPVNVNDSELLPAAGNRAGPSSNAKYEFKNKKDPEPVLSDYLQLTLEPFEIVHDLDIPLINLCVMGDNFEKIKYVLNFLGGTSQE